MSPGRGGSRILAAATCCIILSSCFAAQDLTVEDQVAGLLKLQSKSASGVIELTGDIFDKYVAGPGLPVPIFILADASKMRNQGNMKLGQVVAEYGLVAGALRKVAPGKAFLARIEFSRDQELFGKLGIVSLPHFTRIPPNTAIAHGAAVGLSKDLGLSNFDYPWSAETMAAWVKEVAGVGSLEIDRPTLLKSRFTPVLTLIVVAALATLGFKLYHAAFLRHTWIYVLGGLVIYWFSVSGGMHIIIRGMPFVQYDQRSRESKLFLQGQGQLGAEGYIMGTLYLLFGLAVAAGTQLVPRVKDAVHRRVLGYALVILAAVVLHSVNSTHFWKTGMSASWY